MIHRLAGRMTRCMLSLVLFAPGAWAADVATGKAIAQAKCAACHQPADWSGETAASLQSLIGDVVSGKVKHHKAKVELTDTDIANVAAYWLSAKK